MTTGGTRDGRADLAGVAAKSLARPEDQDLLTVGQAAEYLQLSPSSIRAYIRQGRLKAFRVAGERKILIPRRALLELLEPARGEEHG